jgi:CDGSH-type Zn-finger protein/uncharacterized Fe-S cluster protein YjdI
MSERHQFEGQEIRVTFDAKRCLHAGKCVGGLPAVFDGEKKPWVDADGATVEEVVGTVCQCPTGALQVEALDGSAVETPDAENTITVAADGPLYLRGELRFLDPNEEVVFTETRVALCRCGHSKNKPFCDDAHFDAGFCHSANAFDGKIGDAPEGAGPMNIEPLLNGPNFITGSFQLVSSDGAVVSRGTKTALCRCGHSENKPFCDGSHREKGFEAPVLGS